MKRVRDSYVRQGRRRQAAVRAAVAKETRATQLEIRTRVSRAFAGSKLRGAQGARRVANAVRSKVFDNGRRGAAGLIFSKFGRGRGRSFIDYVAPRLFGAVVRPKKGRFLLVPVATKGRSQRATRRRGKQLAEQGKLDMVPIKGGRRFLLVHRTRTRTTPYFVLLRQVIYRRQTTPRALLRNAARRFPRRVLAELRKVR